MLPASDLAWMSAIVASSLDVTITVQRRSVSQDSYGHANGALATVGTPKVNIIKPSATQLQQYAGLIGSQIGLMVRFMPSSDIREGDQVTNYNGRNWLVHGVQNAESYTFANEVLIVSIV